MQRFAWLILILVAPVAQAGPSVATGDLALRHDIQRLADHGVVTGPVTSWPLAWGPILEDLRNYRDVTALPADVADAFARVRSRGTWETESDVVRVRGRVAAADTPALIRSYHATPREEIETTAALSWIGKRVSLDLSVTVVGEASDDEHVRADGSHLAVALGNWTVAATTMDRWWGPGWDSNLILTNNARPIPSVAIDRTFTNPFSSRWLRWLGPWDLSTQFGRLENERFVPDARFFGMRFNFRPLPSLEIGLSRTAQWCGKGRPCDFDTFVDLFTGRDNIGDEGINADNEPGNQLAGLDFRWSSRIAGAPVAVYGQFIGEDEAGGFPSRYVGQLGIEGSGFAGSAWSYRWFAEAASTSCDFWKSAEIFDCAYEHGIYKTGYRFRGRAIGHSADNDARVATLGVVLVDSEARTWQGYLRTGRLNRDGTVNSRNTVSRLPRDVSNVEIIHGRNTRVGRFELGLGFDYFGRNNAERSSNDVRAFIQWRSDW